MEFKVVLFLPRDAASVPLTAERGRGLKIIDAVTDNVRLTGNGRTTVHFEKALEWVPGAPGEHLSRGAGGAPGDGGAPGAGGAPGDGGALVSRRWGEQLFHGDGSGTAFAAGARAPWSTALTSRPA